MGFLDLAYFEIQLELRTHPTAEDFLQRDATVWLGLGDDFHADPCSLAKSPKWRGSRPLNELPVARNTPPGSICYFQ